MVQPTPETLPELTPMPHYVMPLLKDYDQLMKEVRDIVFAEAINPSAAMIVASLGTNVVYAGQIRSGQYYFGSNPSYNLKSLVADGYIEMKTDPRDSRRKIVRLTPKGLALAEKVRAGLDKRSRRHAA